MARPVNYVVFAVNNHYDFRFLLPLTVILWRTLTRYQPLVMTQYPFMDGSIPHQAGMMNMVETRFPNDPMYVKLARWYSWDLGCVCPDDTLLLMDADLWPVNGEFWDLRTEKPVTMFYGDAFQDKRHVATGGFRATARALKAICRGRSLRERMEKEIRVLPDDAEERHSDDCAQASLFYDWAGDESGCVLRVKRGPSPPKDRIDRSCWPDDWTGFKLDGFVDAHLPRESSDYRVWQRDIRPLFRLLAPGWADWADAYRTAWEKGAA